MAKTRAFLPDFGVFRQISSQFCEMHEVLARLQRFGLETGKSDGRLLGRDNCASRYWTQEKGNLKKKSRIMAGRKVGCTKDYVLVLEADNLLFMYIIYV